MTIDFHISIVVRTLQKLLKAYLVLRFYWIRL